mgnify:CR=1 FL=1
MPDAVDDTRRAELSVALRRFHLTGEESSALANVPFQPAALANLDGMRQWRVREFGAEVLAILLAPYP